VKGLNIRVASAVDAQLKSYTQRLFTPSNTFGLMDKGADFVTRLIGFGLSEKEAQAYLHLLKYGPKTPSPLAKSLKTYREDVHRTLTSLIEKGMVRPSLDSPTIYTAVELDAALDAAVKKHESELREMEIRKRELQDLAKEQRFRPSEEVSTFKMLKSLKEVISTALPVFVSAEEEFLWLSNREGVEMSQVFGILEAEREFIERGGRCRGIADVTYRIVDIIRYHLDIGADVRHIENYRGAYFGVFDKKTCISAINIDIKHIKLDEPLSMLYTDDPVFADYLVSTFEMLWEQGVPAEERIQELLKQGPPRA
jgi:sugar-specific transcriptional regulator TrmB